MFPSTVSQRPIPSGIGTRISKINPIRATVDVESSPLFHLPRSPGQGKCIPLPGVLSLTHWQQPGHNDWRSLMKELARAVPRLLTAVFIPASLVALATTPVVADESTIFAPITPLS